MVHDYMRESLAPVVGGSLSVVRVARELYRLIEQRGVPRMIVSDNGAQRTHTVLGRLAACVYAERTHHPRTGSLELRARSAPGP